MSLVMTRRPAVDGPSLGGLVTGPSRPRRAWSSPGSIASPPRPLPSWASLRDRPW